MSGTVKSSGLCFSALTLSAVKSPTPAARPATSRLRDSAGVHSSSSDEESSLSSILEACVEIEIPSAASSISTQAGTPNFGDRDRVLFYVSFGREPEDAPTSIDPAVAARGLTLVDFRC